MGLSANAGPGQSFEWRGIWASIVISENLPRRTGLSADAGPGTGFEWTPGGRGWEAEATELGAGSWELGAGSWEPGPGAMQPGNLMKKHQVGTPYFSSF